MSHMSHLPRHIFITDKDFKKNKKKIINNPCTFYSDITLNVILYEHLLAHLVAYISFLYIIMHLVIYIVINVQLLP